MVINYDEDTPADLLPIIQKRIDLVKEFFPHWVAEVKVNYYPESNGDAVATVDSNFRYRFVVINLYPVFFNVYDWRVILVHELHHSLMRPYTAVVDSILEKFFEDGPMKRYLMEQLVDMEEQVVQDSAIMVRKMISPE